MLKECLTCQQLIDISLFSSFTRKSGKVYILNHCKDCQKIYKSNHYQNNKSQYFTNNQVYIFNNLEEINSYQQNYRAENKEKIAVYHHNYYLLNKSDLNSYKNQYVIDRLKIDPIFKLRRNASKAIHAQLKKNGSICNYLPYDMNQLKLHLENLFEPWMNWENHGIYRSNLWDDNDQATWTWQIDHIIPQSKLKFNSMEDENFKKCWDLNNLRPFSSKQNLFKGNK